MLPSKINQMKVSRGTGCGRIIGFGLVLLPSYLRILPAEAAFFSFLEAAHRSLYAPKLLKYLQCLNGIVVQLLSRPTPFIVQFDVYNYGENTSILKASEKVDGALFFGKMVSIAACCSKSILLVNIMAMLHQTRLNKHVCLSKLLGNLSLWEILTIFSLFFKLFCHLCCTVNQLRSISQSWCSLLTSSSRSSDCYFYLISSETAAAWSVSGSVSPILPMKWC